MFQIAWSSLKYFGVAVPVSLAFLDNVGTVARVNGSSMVPTLCGDHSTQPDYVWLSSLGVRRYSMRRGEIVAFTSPYDPNRILIKRVIGLPGDTLKTLTYKQPIVRVKEGCMWVEGDNRERSMDSNTFGPIPLGLMMGKASRVIWPPSRWGRLEENPVIGRLENNNFSGNARDDMVLQSLEECPSESISLPPA